MQTSDVEFYAPHCSGCFNTFAEERQPLKAVCAHLYCSMCADPQQTFVCPYDKQMTRAGEFQTCEDIQAMLLRLFTDDFDEVLEAVYEEINTAGVLCKSVRQNRECADVTRCRYFHGQLFRSKPPELSEDLMQSMEPIFPENDLLKDYIVVEKGDEEDTPTSSAQLFELLFRLLSRLKSTLQGFVSRPDLSTSHYD